MKRKIAIAALLFGCLSLTAALAEEGWLNRPDSKIRFAVSTELGFQSILHHTIQFGQSGTQFDYVADGGQDVYFPFKRISADISFGPRHKLVLLYQPIDVRTEVRFFDPVTVYDVTFDPATYPEGLPTRTSSSLELGTSTSSRWRTSKCAAITSICLHAVVGVAQQTCPLKPG